MRFLGWAVRIALFLLVISFAVRNTEPVAVRYYLGHEWEAPLIFVLLLAFCAGVALGLVAAANQLYRQRREIAALRQALAGRGGGREQAVAAAPPLDAA